METGAGVASSSADASAVSLSPRDLDTTNDVELVCSGLDDRAIKSYRIAKELWQTERTQAHYLRIVCLDFKAYVQP